MIKQVITKAATAYVASSLLNYMTAKSNQKIVIRDEEHKEISTQLKAIRDELDQKLNSAIAKMKGTTFYTAGKAKETVDLLGTINNKFLELVDHYEFAAKAVTHSLDTMNEQDQMIGSQITERGGGNGGC